MQDTSLGYKSSCGERMSFMISNAAELYVQVAVAVFSDNRVVNMSAFLGATV